MRNPEGGEVEQCRPVLDRARRLGFLSGSSDEHLAHAEGFATAAGPPPDTAADLGSGGGVPALLLALRWPSTRWVLIERSARRAAFLQGAVEELGIAHRALVEERSAEEVGRSADRGSFDLVTARGFGPAAVTAECAAALLRVGGRLLVSEPPGSTGSRWAPVVEADLGLGPASVVSSGGASFVVLEAVSDAPAWVPRRPGVPARRPRW